MHSYKVVLIAWLYTRPRPFNSAIFPINRQTIVDNRVREEKIDPPFYSQLINVLLVSYWQFRETKPVLQLVGNSIS